MLSWRIKKNSFKFMGLVLLAIGLWAELRLHRYLELSPDFSGTAIYVILGLSCLIVIVNVFALNSIRKGHMVMLYVYAAFLGCVFIMNIGIAASIYCFWDTFPKSLQDGMTQTIVTYEPPKANFDFAQEYFHCCGVSNYTDWIRLSPQKVIPISCCIDPNNCVTANYGDVYQLGCYDVIIEYLRSNMDLLLGASCGAAFLPIFGIGMSCCLANHLKKSKYDNVN
ncbi:tetraspanin-7-like isoform X2 [Trichoplusia ni]|uniref:Tetraspanin n=1 Tax=Trichoplusia ni TaxID=7111 RepID=A0A7E5VFE1_TRINI|nr:tetraspanin-7-like isoform X2 [Trichoplusia ni]